MPWVLTPTEDVSMVRPGQTAGERAIARIAGPLKVGVTVYKTATGWQSGRNISNDVLQAAETVLMGGHWSLIDKDTYDEITAAGITLTALPKPPSMNGFYPSPSIYPSSTLYPGA